MQAEKRQVAIRLSKPQTLARRWLKRGASVCLPWGRGTGKSHFARLLWWLLVAQWDGKRLPGAPHDGIRIVLLMPTLVQAKKVHATLMQLELHGMWAFLGGDLNKSDWRITFPGGSWVQWVTAEGATNIRGLRCDVILVDEADDVDTDVVDAIAFPWLSEPWSMGLRAYFGTPTRGRHGLLYREFRKGIDGHDGCHSLHATFYDCPEFVDIARVERERPFISPALFSREWLCDFDSAEGVVYPMFSESFHVREPWANVEPTETIIGVDHGYEDPGVFLVAHVYGNGRDAIVWIVREVYEQHQTEAYWLGKARELKAAHPKAKWYADPSQPARIEALRTQVGVTIKGADNAIEDGVSAVADRLAIRSVTEGEGDDATERRFARLYIDPSCKNTIREVGLYRRKRDPRNKERILDDIQDRDNHAMDALRYLIFSRFGLPPGTRTDSTHYDQG